MEREGYLPAGAFSEREGGRFVKRGSQSLRGWVTDSASLGLEYLVRCRSRILRGHCKEKPRGSAAFGDGCGC